MVQVLPRPPSLIEQIAPYAQQLVSGLVDYNQKQQKEKQLAADQTLLGQIFSQESGAAPINIETIWGKLSPETRKTFEPFLQSHLRTREAQAKEDIKTKKEELVQQKEHEDISSVINKLTDTLESGNIGKFNQWNTLFAYGRQNRAYFDELALQIEKRLATMVGKGALSVPRFEYLKKNLPSSSDTDASNRGKLKALSEEFKVARTKKPALTEDLLQQWKAEGLTRKEAEARAKEQGYEF